MTKYVCKSCEYIYDEEKEKVTFTTLANEWKCPVCSASKEEFQLIQENKGPIIGTIVDVWDETHDVKTFRIKTENFWFIPGEYCFLSFEKNSKKYGPKPFTFSSAPNGEFVDITIKKIGLFTQTIHTLQKGDELSILGPQKGEVQFSEEVKDDLVFICMGTGIAPFMSALRYAHKHDMKNKITMLCANRTTKDIIFKEELEKFQRLDNNTIIHFISDEDPKEGYIFSKITQEGIQNNVEEPENKLWYICGSSNFSKSVKEWLTNIKIPEEKIITELFTLPSKTDIEEKENE
jgi:ferredoxin-NADP reductase/rubredoxin